MNAINVAINCRFVRSFRKFAVFDGFYNFLIQRRRGAKIFLIMTITCICRQVLEVTNKVGKINDFGIHFNGCKVICAERQQIRRNDQQQQTMVCAIVRKYTKTNISPDLNSA